MQAFRNKILTKNNFQKNIGLRLFQVGLFCLPSAPAISLLFIFPAIIISLLKRRESYLEDKWNLTLVAASFLMITSYAITFYKENYTDYFSKIGPNIPVSSLNDLANWLPLFLCFWAVQPYLRSKENRKICALAFVCGSIPVIVTGFGQYWFNWHGPLNLLNGLVVWFQRPIRTGGGLSGLFNNANYAGALLTMILPFSLASITRRDYSLVKYIITILINISLVTAIILTNSRNAWICLFLALVMMFGSKKLTVVLFSLISTIFISTNFIGLARGFLERIIPPKTLENFDYIHIISDERINIWDNSIRLISQRPLFGFGGSSYENIQRLNGLCIPPTCNQHSHNLPLELALKYGLPTSIILSGTILVLLFLGYLKIAGNKTFKMGLSKSDIYEKAWVTSLFLIFFSHLLDMQYFDIRISFFSWILLAGIKNIIYEQTIEV